MRVRNFANAFVRVDSAAGPILIDPWITNGVYEGTWQIYPEIGDVMSHLEAAVAVLVTHIHADHFDAAALAQTACDIYLPDIYPNSQVAKRKLDPATFRRVRFIPPGEPLLLANKTMVEFVPPMNRFGHKKEMYDAQLSGEYVAIDTGVTVTDVDDRTKGVFLADNFPYHPASAGDSLSRMRGCDVLAFPYNAFADDYPLCHDNLTLQEKRAKSLERNEKRCEFFRRACEVIEPKRIVPYSSDFLLAGPRAIEFLDVHPPTFLDKTQAAQRFANSTGLSAFALGSDDTLDISENSARVLCGSVPVATVQQLKERAKALHSAHHAYEKRFSPVDRDQLIRNARDAEANVQQKAAEYGIETDWTVALEPTDLPDTRIQVRPCKNATGRQTLTCRAPSSYLNALLTFGVHWDNAMIACNLSWTRSADEYYVALYKLLNFFHVRRTIAA